MRRELPCECCGVPVRIAKRERFLQLVRTGEAVRCRQCRRYVSSGERFSDDETPVTARVSQLPTEQVVPALGLRRKVRKTAKRTLPLESCPLKRCGKAG